MNCGTYSRFSTRFSPASGTPAYCFSEQVPQNRPNAYQINLFITKITNAFPRGVFQTQDEDNSCYRNTKLSWRQNKSDHRPVSRFHLLKCVIQGELV